MFGPVQRLPVAGRTSTGSALWLVNDRLCGGLFSETASAPKSSSGTEGVNALSPTPVIGTANLSSPSALLGLSTVSLAASGNGHRAGGFPPRDVDGSHGQLCCGENEIVIVQLFCGPRENGDPGGVEQVSCSAKLGKPLKSLSPKGLAFPAWGLRLSVKPFSVEFDGSLLVSVTCSEIGVDPRPWGGKVKDDGVNSIGCVQLVAVPSVKQMSPTSPGTFPPGQGLVVIPYPLFPRSRKPLEVF